MSADLVITPETLNIHWSQFDQLSVLISRGRDATEKLIPELERALSRSKKWTSRISRWLDNKTY